MDELDAAIQNNDLDELNAVMLERSNDAEFEHRVGMPNSFTIPHDDIEWATQEIRTIFDNAAGDPMYPATETFESRLDVWLGSETLVTSSERVALLSLMYNNVLPSSDNLQDAVRDDDRIRAWFEIRYASNPESGGERNSGLAKRRAYEAALFGLYDNRSKEDQAQDIYDFLNSTDPYNGGQRVVDRILAYEGHTGTGGHNFNSWINDNTASDYDVVDSELVQQISFQTLFLPIANEIAELFAAEGLNEGDTSINAILSLISGSTIDNEIVIGLETDGAVQATNVNDVNNGNDLLIAVDDGGQTLNGGAGSDVLIGASGADDLNGGDGGDVLVGKGGNDNLYGQAGNDSLFGGQGADTLNGGKGVDLLRGGAGGDDYEFSDGDGVDTVEDASTGNTLTIDGDVITELTGVSASNKIYKNESGAIRLVKTDDGFVIVHGDASQTVSAIQVLGEKENFGLTLSDYQGEDTTQPAMDPDSFEVGDSNLGTEENENWLEFHYGARSPEFNTQPIFFDASLVSTDNPDFIDPDIYSWDFSGGDFNDTLVAGPENFNPSLFGMGGDDTIIIGASDWAWATGGEGNDYIRHTSGEARLFGDWHISADLPEENRENDGAGNDILISEVDGFKTIDGGGGGDILIASSGGEGWLAGGSGSDIIQGGGGNDYISGDGR